MKAGLDKAGIPYVQEFPLRSGFIIDFALIDKKIAIECDGEKWHTSLKAMKKDRFRDWMLKRAGWKTLRFSGQQIMNDIDRCIENIRLDTAR